VTSAWRCATAGQTTTIAEDDRGFVGVRGRAGAASAFVGVASGGGELLVDGEREDVGGSGGVEEPVVEIGDGGLVDEDEAELGVGVDPFGVEDELGQADPAGDFDADGVLLVVAADLDRCGRGHGPVRGGDAGRGPHPLARS